MACLNASLIGICLLFSSLLYSQNRSTSGSNLNQNLPTKYLPANLITSSSGLTETDNRFIYYDSYGFVWISSIHGLYRYDGKNVRHYLTESDNTSSLNGHIVNGFFSEDKERNLWFSTYEAINCYIRSEDKFQTFTIPGTTSPGYFTGCLDSLGYLWFLWDTMLLTFQINDHLFDTISTVSSNASRLQIVLDKAGNASSVYVYNTERSSPGFEVIELNKRKAKGTRQFYQQVDEYPLVVRCLYPESDSTVWIASHYGLIHFNIKSGDTSVFSPLGKSERIFFNSLVPMYDSLILACSYGKGAYIFDTRKQMFIDHFYLVHDRDTIKEPLQTLYKDRNNGIWVSVTGKGVAYYHPDVHMNFIRFQFFRHYINTSQSASGINLNSLIELDEERVFGGSHLHGGVLFEGPDRIIDYYNLDNTENWPANNTRLSFKDSHRNIWVLTASGPCVLFPDGHVESLFADQINYVSSICETQPGEIIMSPSGGGLLRCIVGGDQHFRISNIQSVNPLKVYTCLKSYGHLMYGTSNLTSLDIYDPANNDKLVTSIPFDVYTYCIVPIQKKGEIWFGTNEGIFTYSIASHNFEEQKWLRFLSDKIIYGIIPEDDKFVWLSSNNGIWRLNLENESFLKFDASQGTGTNSFNANSYLRRKNGELWFGSQDGITVVHPKEEFFIVPISDIHFSTILVNDVEAPGLTCAVTGSANISTIQSLRLPFSDNTLSFEFAAIDYSGSQNLLYEYKMKDEDSTWVKSDTRGFARFADLNSGNYTFQFRASNKNSGNYSQVRSLEVKIIAPLYQRSWFITLFILVMAAMLMSVYDYNERRNRKIRQLIFEKKLALEAERLRIANDMHDDLGSGLSALSLRAKLLSNQISEPALSKQMNELAGNSDRLSQQIRETIWTINSKHDTVDSLLTRLHQYALEFFEGTEIKCAVELPTDENLSPISGTIRREIYLTFKEALNNIFKHANASAVVIRLYVGEKNEIIIKIQDNGKGFNPFSKSTGTGIDSMKKRIRGIGGHFNISSDSAGTLIQVSYPI